MHIPYQEYQQRRQALAQKMQPGSIAIIPAANELGRNGDSHYRFRQDSDFYYLTGFNEPEALLVLLAGETGDSILFNRCSDPEREQWDGVRLGQDKAPEQLGVQKAYPLERVEEQLMLLLQDKEVFYYPSGRHAHWENIVHQVVVKLKQMVRRGLKAPGTQIDILPMISEMRLFKSNREQALLRQAAAISAAAHCRAMRRCRDLNMEYELEAELCYEFFRQGCRAVAYQPIVGSGDNACILHYGDNDQKLEDGTLVLIDAGGEFHNYAADITRTFPVNGTFTADQKIIYQLVLKAQQAGIAAIKPGLAWNEIQKLMVRILTEGLCDLNILQGSVDALIEQEAYRPYYMHNSGHWLGLDVHDCGAYKVDGQWRLLQQGMVLTVEPGLYFSPTLEGLDPRWKGIGVRIEDDILVTRDGHENLSAAVPVEIDAIEALMRD